MKNIMIHIFDNTEVCPLSSAAVASAMPDFHLNVKKRRL